MKNVSEKLVEKMKTRILCPMAFLSNPAVYDVIWENIVEPDRTRMAIWRMRIACWITKATNAHSEYVILTAFPLQHWLRERASMLHYTYLNRLVLNSSLRAGYNLFLCAVFSTHTRWEDNIKMVPKEREWDSIDWLDVV
jgi:hypothetical protein